MAFQPTKAVIANLAAQIKDACTSQRMLTQKPIYSERWWSSFELHSGHGRYRVSVEFLGPKDGGSRPA